MQTWPKEFYVSPFNSRLGSYSVTARDPLSPHLTGDGMINTTITLTSSEKHPKLVARVFSITPPISPDCMSVWEKTSFLGVWWWVGLATFPRTVKEAFKLFVGRGQAWVSRPEPKAETLSRHADAFETLIESIFREYLRYVVESAGIPLKVKYTPYGISDCRIEILVSPGTQLFPSSAEPEQLDIKVLSPTFYTNFSHAAHPIAILLASDKPRYSNQSPTLKISNRDILRTLYFDLCPQPTPYPLKTLAIFERIEWKVIQSLRHHAFQIPPPPSPKRPRCSRFTAFEAFIFEKCEAEERKEYARRKFKMMISERIAFGWVQILNLEIFVLKGVCIWMLAGFLA